MSIFDFLKRKKEVEKAISRSAFQNKPEKKLEKVFDIKKHASIDAQSTASVEEKLKPSKLKISGGFSYDAVKEPHISEKGTILSESNRYTFKVDPSANKKEVKKSVEGIYRVNVLSVNIIKIPAKKRRIGRTEGFKKGYIKAIVKIKEGQKIEIL